MAVFTGTIGDDRINGFDDDDTIFAGGGGFDVLDGRGGNDRYVVDRPPGELFFSGTVVVDDSGSELNLDTVDITDFVLIDRTATLVYEASGDDLRIFAGFNAELRLVGQLRADLSNIEVITYAGSDLNITLLKTVDELAAAIDGLVASTDRPPILLEDLAFAIDEDTTVSADLAAIVADQDNDPIAFTLKSKPNFGEVRLDGSLLGFDPGPDNSGSTTVLVEARSGGLEPLKLLIPIEVAAVNDAPTARDDVATLAADRGSIVLDVLRNDVDVDGDALTIESVFGAPNVTIRSDGTLLYQRDDTLPSPHPFLYTIVDPSGAKDVGLVTVTVVSAAAPVTVDDRFDGSEAKLLKGLKIDVLRNDTSELGRKGIDRNTITIVEPPSQGSLSLSKGKLTYRADSVFDGEDSFSYTVADSAGRVSDVATVVITGPDLTI